ncbi:reverse transcriptase [Senna tora]|uniref:Reverse transcriptase n=1 Tax=Senna tora TaxID=362788 RepID=A0A834SQG5_9FABA|nr:reverse transcriptase [Senna tora]
MLKRLYFPSCSFMEAKKGARASWAWSSILEDLEGFKVKSLPGSSDLREQVVAEYITNEIWDLEKLKEVVRDE